MNFEKNSFFDDFSLFWALPLTGYLTPLADFLSEKKSKNEIFRRKIFLILKAFFKLYNA